MKFIASTISIFLMKEFAQYLTSCFLLFVVMNYRYELTICIGRVSATLY